MMSQNDSRIHTFFMRQAIVQAKKALVHGDVPIGAVIVSGGKIIARAYNQVEKQGNPLAHAEILAIGKAIKKTNYKHLLDCALYVTLEPCPMCAGAIILARIPRVVYATTDPKTGACHSLYSITNDTRLNHRCEVISGVLQEDSSTLLKKFFRELREKKK